MSAPRALPRLFLVLVAAAFAAFFLWDGETAPEYGPGLAGEPGAPRAPGALGAAGDPSLHAGGRARPDPAAVEAERERERAAAREALKADGVHGVVMDGKGKPIAGATVALLADPAAERYRFRRPDGAPVAVATTLADGTFVVGPLPADGRGRLRAEAPGYAPTVQPVRARGGRVDLILDLGGTFEARVLDAEGKGVPEATLLHSAGPVVTEAATDAEGGARLANLPTGTGNLVVYKRGFAAITDNDVSVAPGATEQRTYVLPAAVALQGKVERAEDSLPVAGASVWLEYSTIPGLGKSAVVTSDAQGAFEVLLEVGGQEQFTVHATKEGFGEARQWLNAQHRGEVIVQLRPGAPGVEGRVFRAEGGPAEGAEVSYAFLGTEPNPPTTRTDARGNFALPALPHAKEGDSWTLVAEGADGSLGTVQYQVPKADAGRPPPVEIRLGAAGIVRGRVTGGAGEPLGGALVELQPDWSGGGRPLGPNDWMMLRIVQEQAHGSLSAVSDAQGGFVIPGVPALAYRLSAQWGLQRATRADSVQVQAGREVEVEIALGEAGTIEGWVLDGEERPIPGAYVYANVEQPGQQQMWWGGGTISARSQSDGRFILRGVAYGSRYTIYATAAGFGSANQKGSQLGDRELVLRLVRRGWIEGVVYQDGVPYRGTFTVQAVVRQEGAPNAGRRFWGGPQHQNTFNTDDGRFTLRGMAAGEYTLQASTPDGLIAAHGETVRVVDGRASNPARLELTPGARLVGRVLKGGSEEPIAGAWIHASLTGDAAQLSANTRSDARGAYELKGLAAGTWTVQVWAPTGSSWSTTAELDPGGTRQLDLVELAPGSVVVTVLDEADQPVGGARVHLRSETGQYLSVNPQAMQRDGLLGETYNWQELYDTNAEGVLTRWHLPPGRHEVWATKNGYERTGDRTWIVVQSGVQAEVTVRVRAR